MQVKCRIEMNFCHLSFRSDLDKKRIKHLASTFQDLILAEIRHDEEKSREKRKCFFVVFEMIQIFLDVTMIFSVKIDTFFIT